MDSAQGTHDASDPDDIADDTAQDLPDALRRARKAKGWSQSQLGEAIGASRYTIIRLEAGRQDLTVEVARQIESALEAEGLAALVTKREQLADRGERRLDRDIVVRRLLGTQRLQRVQIVLADDLDVHAMVAGNRALDDARVQVFVPTAARERELFHGQPIYGHIENQIMELSGLAVAWSSHGRGSLEIYESSVVHAPAVLVRSPTGIECAYWPVVPSGPVIDGHELQAVSSPDPRVTAQIEAHLEAMQAGASTIKRNEALAIVDAQPRPKGENRPIVFTRFQAVGQHSDQGENEAVTVALVLIHTVCPRRDLGVKRRILVHSWIDDPDQWSLPGHVVEEIDVRRARRRASGDEYIDILRSSQEPFDATLAHADYLGGGEGEIPLDVFKEAASRGLRRDFGVEIATDRLENVVLPPALQRISKEHPDRDDSVFVRSIVPRLFTLDLSVVPGESGAHELSEIKKRARVEEWGYEDLLERHDLNDFLTDAKGEGFLLNLCHELEIAPR
jgi:transcriptional regulator with XRE-family HTH domain